MTEFVDPATFPNGYYAVADPDDPDVITCWRHTEAKGFAKWQRGARYGPAAKVLRRDVPKDPHAREEFMRPLIVAHTAWCQQVYAAIAADFDAAQKRFGSFTGHCGCCGRALTDPTSKLYGIGPECRKGTRAGT